MSAWRGAAFALAACMGCAPSVERAEQSDGPSALDRFVMPVGDSSARPAGGEILAGEPPPGCGLDRALGKGTTWLESPPKAERSRALRCLTQDTPALAGRFLARTSEASYALGAGHSVLAENRVYDYPLADERANHPALYYVITEMALGLSALPFGHESELWESLAPVDAVTGPFFLGDSYYTGEVVVLGRGGLPGRNVDVQMVAHEYGHHVVKTLAPDLARSTLHEGIADYLACAFTGNAGAVESLPEPLRRPCANGASWPSGMRDVHEACVSLVTAFVAAGWDKVYVDDYEGAVECAKAPPPYTLEGHQTGMIVSGALWTLTEELGPEVMVPLLLKALTLLPRGAGGDFGMLRQALNEADVELHRGAHGDALDAELERRGILSDVGLEDLEWGAAFPCLYTPEHAALDRLPAGPIFPMSRPRRR